MKEKASLGALLRRNKVAVKAISMLLCAALMFCFIPTVIYAEIGEAIEASAANSGQETETSPTTSGNVSAEDSDIVYEEISMREESVKHFRLSDGSYIAAQYAYPVHYTGEDGALADIDNRLEEGAGGMYASANARIKLVKKTGGSGELLTLKDGSTKITLSLEGARKGVTGSVINGSDAEGATELQKMLNLEKLSSSVVYENILDGVDIEYVIHSLNVKENIIVKEKKSSYEYTFELKLNGLTAALTSCGDIEISEGGELKYVMPAPVVYDNNGVYAPDGDSEYTLTPKGNGKYTLTVSVDAEWMNDADRAYPVTVDPTIGQTQTSTYMLDTYIDADNSATSYYSATSLRVSYNDILYWRATQLPALPVGAFINGATLGYRASSVSAAMDIGAHQVTNAWGSPMTYANYNLGASAFEEGVMQDYINVKTAGTYHYWNITEAAREWYANSATNFGIAIKPLSSRGYTSSYYALFNSLESSSNDPRLAITYRIISGVEDYYPTVSHSAGIAGVGSVNLANGSLTFAIPTLTTTDSLMPYTPTLVYNSTMAGVDYKASTSTIGHTWAMAPVGMMLNASESIKSTNILMPDGSRVFYLIYTDSDGSAHYLKKESTSSTKYTDEDGLGIVADYTSDAVTLTFRDKTVKYFAKITSGMSWYLQRITDTAGNSLVFTVDSDKRPVAISLDPQGSVGAIEMLRLYYNSNDRLVRVYNPTSYEAAILRYSSTYDGDIVASGGGYLRQIDFVHGTSATTDDNWSAFIASQSNATNITVDASTEYTYKYGGDLGGALDCMSDLSIRYLYSGEKLSRVYENKTLTETHLGASVAITYGNGYTDVRAAGSDDALDSSDDIITRYVLDSFGRAVSIYSFAKDGGEIYGADYGQYSEEENSKNSISQKTTLGGSSVNYILNGGFENGEYNAPSYWELSGNAVCVSSSSNTKTGRRLMSLEPNPGQTAGITQTVRLNPGDYTLSFPFTTQCCDLATVAVTVAANSVADYSVSDDLDLNPTASNGIYSFFQMTFSVTSTAYYRIEIEVDNDSSANVSATIEIDNVMLEKGKGSSDFSLIEYGSFEVSGNTPLSDKWLAPGGTYILSESGGELFGSALWVNSNTTTSSYKQRIFEATESEITNLYSNNPVRNLILSGYAKGESALLSGSQPFRLRMEIAYFQGYDANRNERPDIILNHYVDFLPGVSDWQFASGTFSTYPDEVVVTTCCEDCLLCTRSGCCEDCAECRLCSPRSYNVIRYIDVYCEYLNQPNGTALFDNISLIEDKGKTTVYSYTDSGLVKTAATDYYRQYTIYDDLDRVIRVADTKGDVVDYTYVGNSELVDYAITSYADNPMSKSYADYAGETSTVVSLTYKNKVDYTYNAYGQVTAVETSAYDSSGNISTTTAKFRTEYTYNTAAGSKIFGAMTQEKELGGSTVCYYYDAAKGYLLASINISDGNGLAYTYDALGRMTKVVPARSTTSASFTLPTTSVAVQYAYNSNGNLAGIQTYHTTYSFFYDNFGNLISVGADGGEIVGYEYNEYNGKLIKTIYANGLTEEYVYNDIELLSEIWYTEGETSTLAYKYEYTAAGMVYKITDHINGKKTVYKYDSRDRVTDIAEYDADTDLHEFSMAVYYNDKSQLSNIFGDIQYGEYNQPIDYSYTYNADNTLSRMKYTSNTTNISATLNYSYDRYSRLIRHSDTYKAFGATLSASSQYTYATETVNGVTYATSQIATHTREFNGTTTTEQYTYNDKGYIASVRPDNTSVYGIYYWYDNLGQLVRVDDEIYNMTTVYTYDGAGNLLSSTYAPYTQGDLDEILGTDYYVYNDSISGDHLTSYNGHSITYDAIGNPLTYYNGRSYTFTWNGRQMTSATVGGKTYYFTYDSNGLRKTKTVDGVTTTYYYDGGLLIAEQNENETIVYIYDANGSPIGMQYRLSNYAKDAWDVYWYEKNLLGDVIAVYNNAGTKLLQYTYNDAWGRFTRNTKNGGASTTAVNSPFTYRGYYYDADLEMYYLQSRYYDAKICRFISPDSVEYLGANGDLMSYNLYAYCSNNPVMFRDDSGHVSQAAIIAGAIISGAVVGGLMGAFSALCTDGDVAEAAIIGAATGAVSIAFGVFTATQDSVYMALIAGAIGFAIDAGVQCASQYLDTGSVDLSQVDWRAAANTGLLTFTSTIIPPITIVPGANDPDVIASAIVWNVSSVLLTAFDVIDEIVTPPLPYIG